MFIRLLLAGSGGVLVVLLGIAATLQPNSQGFGTHRQLWGLPECSFIRLTGGTRCPSCGMTTSWAHMMRGHVFRSFGANSGGALLAIIAILMGPWMLLSGLIGRWIVPPPDDRIVLLVGVTVLAVTLIDWGFRLAG